MTFVLVHGGGFSSTCWDPMIPYLRGDAIAVDLPGRGRRPADLTSVTLDDYVDAIVEDIESAGLDDVVLVGHSAAGKSLPGVALRIPSRLRRLVFVSCMVPAHGKSGRDTIAEVLAPDVGETAAENAERRVADDDARAAPLDPETAKRWFANDMDAGQTEVMLAALVPEPLGTLDQPVDLSGVGAIPRTWVRLLRDNILTPAIQDRFIANLGGADVVELDAGHMAMMSRPRELAAILDDVATRPASG
jgi:pimeloyl-ACP methyl ester carboxylesterase